MYKINIILLIVGLLICDIAKGEEFCEPLDYIRPPHDYNSPISHQPSSAYPDGPFKMVKKFHFTRETQQLTGDRLTGNLHFLIRAFPNFPEGLETASRYHYKRVKNPRLAPLERPIECYFQISKEFQPNDPMVYMVHGLHYQRGKKLKLAFEEYKQAHSLGLNSTEFNYNFGLLLFELKQYKESRKFAKLAYDKKFPLEGLKNKLKSVDEWQ